MLCHGATAWLFVLIFVFCLSLLFSPSPAPSLCMCLWAWQRQQQQQQSGTPESDQLITYQHYLPGLSTTSLLNYYIPYGDYTKPLFSVCLKLEYFVSLYFCLYSNALVFVGSSRTLKRRSALLPACLHSWVPPHQLQSTLLAFSTFQRVPAFAFNLATFQWVPVFALNFVAFQSVPVTLPSSGSQAKASSRTDKSARFRFQVLSHVEHPFQSSLDSVTVAGIEYGECVL